MKVELLNGNGQVIATTFTDAKRPVQLCRTSAWHLLGARIATCWLLPGWYRRSSTGGDASIDDLIAGLVLGSGDTIREANFCEVPPATISGYVFQDGAPIVTSDINSVDLNTVRNGQRTSDDKPIGQVRLQLRTIAGTPIDSSRAHVRVYTTQ